MLQVLGCIRISLHHDDHDLAARIAGAGYIVLLTVDDPFVTIQHRCGADVGGIGGRHARLGHGKGRTDLAIQQRLQPLLFLRLGAVLVQHFHIARIRRRAVEHFSRHMRLPHLLGEVGVFHGIQAGAGVAIGEEEVPQSLGFAPWL